MLFYDSESVKEFREHPQKTMYETSVPVGVLLMHDIMYYNVDRLN